MSQAFIRRGCCDGRHTLSCRNGFVCSRGDLAFRKNENVLDRVRIRFALDRDEDGWPPAESEGLWAVPLAGTCFESTTLPGSLEELQRRTLSKRALMGRSGVVRSSSRARRPKVVRVIPRVDGPLGGSLQSVLERVASLGVGAEGMLSPVNMVALDIEPNAPLRSVKALLASGEADGLWLFEEDCITEEWRAAS